MDSRSVICLICCRGGSKGIADKNIKDFNGKPMLAWTLLNAFESEVFDKIYLSTDSELIGQIGEKYGAIVPGLRPDYLATDDSDQFDTHSYVFEKLGISDKNSIVCILNNNPLINSNIISRGYKKYVENNFNQMVIDSVEIEGDYHRFKHMGMKNRILKPLDEIGFKNFNINRQTLSKSYVCIFNMRWANPSELQSFDQFKKKILENGVLPLFLKKYENIDIDDIEDFKIAETIHKHFYKNK